jgi:hypothetical protein
LAVATTGEYAQFHGGSKAQALAAVVTTINRVNQIYNRDVAIQFMLVANNDDVIYTNGATDNYTNTDAFAMLAENENNLDAVIGSANYDIGHVFATGGGGLAGVGVVCKSWKWEGVSGFFSPENDPFAIDLVAHEIGHQLDADHTFNGTTDPCGSPGNRVAGSAVEPGSGSTIMSYAGICGGEDLQSHSDATFHAKSIEQIVAYSAADGSCGTLSLTGNSAPTEVNAGNNYTIPKGTPFVLSGSATDSDAVSYQWDEMDTGTATDITTFGTDQGDNPLFRSFLPKSTPIRIVPRLSELLKGLDGKYATTDKGEVLPNIPQNPFRILNFRLTARDGNAGVDEDDMQVEVDDTEGPFEVTAVLATPPSSALTITWTTNATCSSNSVTIDLLAFSNDASTYCDGADTPPFLNLGTRTYGDGTATITPQPDLTINKARVRVSCVDNIFFNISDADIALTGNSSPDTDCKLVDGASRTVSNGVIDSGDNLDPNGGGTGSGGGGGGGGGGAVLWMPLLIGIGSIGRYLVRRRSQSA